MDKNIKKDLEQMLIKETEKILHKVDPASTVIFSKHIKNYCKDLAKKFLKTQRKFQKQMEVISSASVNIQPNTVKNPLENSQIKPITRTSKTVIESKKEVQVKAVPTKKNTVKKTRKGNNLINAATVQKKAKARVVKSVQNSIKK
ncbi:MAG TPA: hypothetical protein PK323_07235 [Bacteroidia bacterium]|nr:hypothetical protein [Bacteroidia bacterium]